LEPAQGKANPFTREQESYSSPNMDAEQPVPVNAENSGHQALPIMRVGRSFRFLSLFRTTASKTYTDLMWRASAKWANWEPAVPIKVGDYGSIDSKTGLFERRGSIYDEAIRTSVSGLDLLRDFPPKAAEPEQSMIITSGVKSKNAVPPDASGGVTARALLGVSCQWHFGRTRGAVLAIILPRHTYLNSDVSIDRLLEVPLLAGMYLVTSTVTCPAYAFYLSKKNRDSLSLRLVAKPAIAGSSATPRGEFAAEWEKEPGLGFYRDAIHSTDDLTPLVTLKMVERPPERR